MVNSKLLKKHASAYWNLVKETVSPLFLTYIRFKEVTTELQQFGKPGVQSKTLKLLETNTGRPNELGRREREREREKDRERDMTC